MADLFRKVIIKGTQQGQNLTSGSFLTSQDDYLIQTLEQREQQDVRVINQNEASIMASEDVFNSDDLTFLTEAQERLWIQEIITDVTSEESALSSTQLWFLHMGGSWESGGVSTLSGADPAIMHMR